MSTNFSDWSDLFDEMGEVRPSGSKNEHLRVKIKKHEKVFKEVWEMVKSSESILRTLRLPIRTENEKKDKVAVLKLYSVVVKPIRIPQNNKDLDILTKRLYDKLISN